MSRPNTAALTETTAPQLSEPTHETNNVPQNSSVASSLRSTPPAPS